MNILKTYLDVIEMLGYQVVKRLLPSTCYVYLVQKDAAYSTIKMGCSRAQMYREDWAYNHVQQETEVLKRVKDIENIAHKKSAHLLTIQKNDTQFQIAALVKEYIKGNDLRNNYDYKGQLIPFANKQKLNDAVAAIHAAEIACLDLFARNIVIDPAGEPFLIDLGTVVFKESLPNQQFQYWIDEDLSNLEKILTGNYSRD